MKLRLTDLETFFFIENDEDILDLIVSLLKSDDLLSIDLYSVVEGDAHKRMLRHNSDDERKVAVNEKLCISHHRKISQQYKLGCMRNLPLFEALDSPTLPIEVLYELD